MTAKRPRAFGECPTCLCWRAVKKDGTMQKHQRDAHMKFSRFAAVNCEGGIARKVK